MNKQKHIKETKKETKTKSSLGGSLNVCHNLLQVNKLRFRTVW